MSLALAVLLVLGVVLMHVLSGGLHRTHAVASPAAPASAAAPSHPMTTAMEHGAEAAGPELVAPGSDDASALAAGCVAALTLLLALALGRTRCQRLVEALSGAPPSAIRLRSTALDPGGPSLVALGISRT